jgi:hypothetical protein
MAKLIVVLVAAAALGACRRTVAPPAAPTPAAPPAPAVAPAPVDAGTPLAADYDPIALADRGTAPLDIYLAEPRNPAWAAVVEDVIGGQLRRDLAQMVPESHGLTMTCRTLSCLIVVDVPKEKLEAASAVVSLVTLGPITADLGLSAAGRAQMVVLADRRMADGAGFTAWYRRARAQTLADIRSGKRPNNLPVEVAHLPSE